MLRRSNVSLRRLRVWRRRLLEGEAAERQLRFDGFRVIGPWVTQTRAPPIRRRCGLEASGGLQMTAHRKEAISTARSLRAQPFTLVTFLFRFL